MNTQEAKIVLETALICAQEPLRVSDMRRLFADAISADTIRALLEELRTDWRDRGVELVSVATGMAIPEPSGNARISGSAQSGEAAKVFACSARDARDHCVSSAGHAWRY
ncbi:Segregation and condensation protein ScpB [Mycetohabitans rhizoxinica HKI 454]|uniref:Segregation and condensation protein ScpB n=1 Tax=Mycetohabitans rhizoxinica (strain DSM 19002 / CIP 109453 / HKI 454) TaxID=882378 RepID=E5AQS8_MYCRK|nr:Segregation and condensation protein ScpB [Mycetohabitans rhizoxinica HKI 454]